MRRSHEICTHKIKTETCEYIKGCKDENIKIIQSDDNNFYIRSLKQ